jgi:hypothetical protein
MPIMDRIYHLTQAGRHAIARPDCGLPRAIRELLGSIGFATPLEEIAARLGRYGKRDIQARLEDLEAIGLVESIAADWLLELLALGSWAPQPIGAPH